MNKEMKSSFPEIKNSVFTTYFESEMNMLSQKIAEN